MNIEILKTLIKEYLLETFKKNSVPLGHHKIDFNYINLNLHVKLSHITKEHSYISKINLLELQKYVFTNVKTYEVIKTVECIEFEVLMNTFDKYSYLIISEFKWIQRDGIFNSHRLYYQLSTHKLQNFNTSQESIEDLFEKLIKLDENYYSELYTEHWRSGNSDTPESYDNDEIIKLFVRMNHVKLNYEMLIKSLNNPSTFLILMDHMELSNIDENYDLLKEVVRYKNPLIIEKTLNCIKDFRDWGILLEAIRINNTQILDLLLKDKRVNKKDIIMDVINFGFYESLEFILHNSKNLTLLITEDHLDKCKLQGKWKMLNILQNF
jgi:hypothetical protein